MIFNGTNLSDQITNTSLSDDTYKMGIGNDTITDMGGNDTYNFAIGDGQDLITDYTGNDTLVFGTGITSDMLSFTQEGNNLVISIKDSTNKLITIANWYTSPDYKLEKFQFSDGTYLTPDDIDKPILPETEKPDPTVLGTENKDVLNGTAIDDCITGLDGNDKISDIKGGNDSLYGDSGNDKIMDKAGNDYINGGEGNDHIQDFRGDDTIAGGTGNDMIYDYKGSDTYLFNTGDGVDTIFDKGKDKVTNSKKSTGTPETDKIVFGSDVTKESIIFLKKGNDLVVYYGTEDKITVKNQTKKGVEEFYLSTGEVLTHTDVTGIIQQMTAYSKENGIPMKTPESIRSNQELMNIIVNSWHA